jgi:deoxyribodipyrimidine photolyase-like uncharacterized protein
MTAKTSQHLADVLRAAGFVALAKRAEADEFHDFLSPHVLPEMELDRELYQIAGGTEHSEHSRLAAHHIRMRLHDGEFDASTEESEAWAESEDGQAAMRELRKGLR